MPIKDWSTIRHKFPSKPLADELKGFCLGTSQANFLTSTASADALRTLKSVMSSAREQQDLMCRVLGRFLSREPMDRKLGALVKTPSATREPKHFTYMRYDHYFTDDEQVEYRERYKSRGAFSLDALP